MRTLPLTSGATVLIEHANEPARVEQLSRALSSLGLSVTLSAHGTASYALIVRTRRASELAALLGQSAPSAVPVLLEDELDRITVREDPGEQDSFAALVRRVEHVESLALDARIAALDALLCDPRMLEHPARARLLLALERLPPANAIAILAALLRAPFGATLTAEALLLGRLAAAGHARFSHPWTFAIELDDARDELAPLLLAQFRSAPTYERTLDERGYAVHRARFDAVPWIDDEGSERAAPLVLLRAVSALEGARVWFAGCPLPASLPWPLWTALLGQRAGR